MASTVRVRLSQYQEWARRLNERIVRTPAEILNQIGAAVLATSQRSFRDQRLGSFVWPARYPHQSGLKLNIAGAVTDLANGPTVKARRFDDRPALKDTGMLQKSVAFRREGSTVVVGSNLPYASLHQGGGVSRIPITQTIRDNLAQYLKRLRGQTKRAEAGKATKKKKGVVIATVSGAASRHRLSAIEARLGFLFKKSLTVLTTTVNRRPFIGIDDKTQVKLIRIVERDLPKGLPR